MNAQQNLSEYVVISGKAIEDSVYNSLLVGGFAEQLAGNYLKVKRSDAEAMKLPILCDHIQNH